MFFVVFYFSTLERSLSSDELNFGNSWETSLLTFVGTIIEKNAELLKTQNSDSNDIMLKCFLEY